MPGILVAARRPGNQMLTSVVYKFPRPLVFVCIVCIVCVCMCVCMYV